MNYYEYAILSISMLAMGFFGGLIAFLIIRPWLTMRHDREASREVIAENSRLAAAQVQEQTAEAKNRAMQAARRTEQTRAQLIEDQAENDQLEIKRRVALKQAGVDPDAPPSCKPKSWLHEHWFLAFIGLIILIIILSKLNLI